MVKIIKKAAKLIGILWSMPKGWGDYIFSLTSYFFHSSRAWGQPVHLTIEPANICNLRCPVCETGAGQLKRPKGYLGLEQYKKIIDQVYTYTNTILFYFMGEPFLNKEAYEMIAYARSKHIFVITCTNGEYVAADRIVSSDLNEISFQIGGLTQHTHQIYRVGSDLNKIVVNIKNLVAEKKKRLAILPRITLGFIVMKHNEQELPGLKDFAHDLGVDEVQVISPCVRTIAQAKELLPADKQYRIYDEEKLDAGLLAPKINGRKSCPWIYFSTTILWNGDVVPCCRDAQGEMVMGNVLNEDFSRIWNSSLYRRFRKNVREQSEDMFLCRLCAGYGIPDLKKG